MICHGRCPRHRSPRATRGGRGRALRASIHRRCRRVSLVTAGALSWDGVGSSGATPTVAIQLTFLGGAGVRRAVATVRTPLTDESHRVGGAGWGTSGWERLCRPNRPGSGGESTLAVAGSGGLRLDTIGIDTPAFHGRHTHDEPLGESCRWRPRDAVSTAPVGSRTAKAGIGQRETDPTRTR
jgi:hypothetical protein